MYAKLTSGTDMRAFQTFPYFPWKAILNMVFLARLERREMISFNDELN